MTGPGKRTRVLAPWTLIAALIVPAVTDGAQEPPPIPPSAEILLVGSPGLNGELLGERVATMVMGRAPKTAPLELGATVEAGAVQAVRFERVTENAREILRRTATVTRPGSDEVLMRASIDMDPETLLPLVARTEQGGVATVMEYDWEKFVVRTQGEASSEVRLDMPMLEVGAHDVWMAALPLREGFVGRIPAVFGATGTKYWAVPRVVGSEPFALGDGEAHAAWVVELDWWGMGADNTADNHSKGGGANGTAGPGGKYWVLKDPPAGIPHVVRVQTEADATTDRVIQLQAGK